MRTRRREFDDFVILLRFPDEDVAFDYLPTIDCPIKGTDGNLYVLGDKRVFDLTLTPPSMVIELVPFGLTKSAIVNELIVSTTPKKEQQNENPQTGSNSCHSSNPFLDGGESF